MASWKPIFDAVLDLYDDLSTLLRDVDYQLDRHGYVCVHPQHYGFAGTAALDRPRAWLPTWFARLYARQGEQASRRFLAIGMLLHPAGMDVLNPSWADPQVPILLGSAIRYREPPGDGWDLRHGLLWLQTDAPLDGTVHRVVPPAPEPPLSVIEYADVMALPLEAIRTGEDIRGMVLDPLRRLI